MKIATLGLTLSLIAITFASSACAQILAPEFADDYSIIDLGAPTGITGSLGGITFLNNDTLLIGGNANSGSGQIFAIGVERDPVNHFITGFSGPATFYANAPYIDGGLAFGPDGVLFYTAYPQNQLGQIKPGSTGPDKVLDLNSVNVGSSVGSLQFVPTGFDGAGQLKLVSYNQHTLYTASLTADGLGTFDIDAVSSPLTIGGGPEGLVYVSGANPVFNVDSILVSEYGNGRIAAYENDLNGNPIIATRREFITGLSGAEGAAIDPVTGDFLFSTFGGGNRVIVATGFTVVPEPSSLVLVACAGLSLLGFARYRKR